MLELFDRVTEPERTVASAIVCQSVHDGPATMQSACYLCDTCPGFSTWPPGQQPGTASVCQNCSHAYSSHR